MASILNSRYVSKAGWIAGAIACAFLLSACHHHHDYDDRDHDHVVEVDTYGHHHEGWREGNHWHGGWYDERHEYHADPDDWHR